MAALLSLRRSWVGVGAVGAAAIMPRARASAPAIRSGMSRASGRFRQYFFGISAVIAFTLRRAGLKMEA